MDGPMADALREAAKRLYDSTDASGEYFVREGFINRFVAVVSRLLTTPWPAASSLDSAPDAERALLIAVARAAKGLLGIVERHEADDPDAWRDRTCGECVGPHIVGPDRYVLCARHAAVKTLAALPPGLTDGGGA